MGEAGRPAGGRGAQDDDMHNFLSPHRFLLGAEEDDMDAVIELVLPAGDVTGGGEGDGGRRRDDRPARSGAGKRRRRGGGARVEEESPGRRIQLPACSFLLTAHSSKEWVRTWAGGEKRLRFTIESEAEVQAFSDLLAFCHSHGKSLPQGWERLLQLLLLARRECADPSLLACATALQAQVEALCWEGCLALVAALVGGVSPHAAIQAAADACLDAALTRAAALLAAEPGLLRGEWRLEALLGTLGCWDGMLREPALLRHFCSLPAEAIQDVFAHDALDLDIEATALCAFAAWTDQNSTVVHGRAGGALLHRVLSCIRFPDIYADLLLGYWEAFRWLRTFDPHKELIIKAMVCQLQRHLWAFWADLDRQAQGANEERDKMRRWWIVRPGGLRGVSSLESTVEVQPSPPGTLQCFSSSIYWGGCHWAVLIHQEERSDALGVFLCCSHTTPFCWPSEWKAHPVSLPEVAHEVLVEHAAQGTVTLLEGCGHFTPASASHWSWGHASALSSLYSADDGSPLMLSNLLTDQSPFASGGKLRLTLRLQLA